jgi:hypothetical protein
LARAGLDCAAAAASIPIALVRKDVNGGEQTDAMPEISKLGLLQEVEHSHRLICEPQAG